MISLPFAWTLRGEHTTVADIVRYSPLLLLVLGLIAGLVERIVRKRAGMQPRTFRARLALTYARAEAVLAALALLFVFLVRARAALGSGFDPAAPARSYR